jgi:hypothetical protein
MGDLTYINRTDEVKIAGQDSSGNNVNYVGADTNGNMLVKDYADGPVAPGTAATVSTLMGAQFNTVLPTFANTQQGSLQVDASGRLIIRPLTSADVVSAAQSGTWTVQQGGAPWSVSQSGSPWGMNLTQVGGVNVSTGTGASGTGIPRVTVANDSNILATQSGTWTVAQGTAAALSSAWPIKLTDGTNTMPTMDVASRAGFMKVTDGTNTMPTGDAIARAIYHQITDGTTGPVAVKAASTAAVAADKSLVVTISPNSAALQVSQVQASASTGFARGFIALAGGTAGSYNAIRATPYAEQSSNAQRSMSSASANDTSAGTGAQQVTVVYYDSTGAGPNTEVITLNGTTAVNTVGTNICFIESMTVTRVGSGDANAGIITLFTTTAGGGTAIGTIGVGNFRATIGDNKTWWAHHYVATGKTATLATMVVGITPTSNTGTYILTSKPIGVAGAVEIPISEILLSSGASVPRDLQIPIKVVGPARVTANGITSANSTTLNANFDYSEQ